jgi:hypothetical protein
MTLLLCLYVMPVAALAIWLGLGLLLVALVWIDRRQSRQRRRDQQPEGQAVTPYARATRFEYLIFVGGIALQAVINTAGTPWLPTESVSIGNAAPFTAYVLGQQGEDLVYLQD